MFLFDHVEDFLRTGSKGKNRRIFNITWCVSYSSNGTLVPPLGGLWVVQTLTLGVNAENALVILFGSDHASDNNLINTDMYLLMLMCV